MSQEAEVRDMKESDCWEKPSEILTICPYCLGKVYPNDLDYTVITLDDGIYQCEDKKPIWWGMGYVMNNLVILEKGDFETYVNGVCKECMKIIMDKKQNRRRI